MIIVEQPQFAEVSFTVDLLHVKISLGEVYMLMGKNAEALGIFQNLLKEPEKFNENMILELKYKIGCIYHYMGKFESSIPAFIAALDKLNIKFPKNNFALFAILLIAIGRQFFFPFVQKYILTKKSDQKHYLIVRILNLLSYSLYFEDMNLTLFYHFKSLNFADRLMNCNEKIFSYSAHGIASYQMLLKKRAFRYLKRSIIIAQAIHRKDSYGFAQYFYGVANYINAHWKESASYLQSSINSFNSIGDISNLPQCTEHLWKINIMLGNFREAERYLKKTISICQILGEKHFLSVALASLSFVKYITTKEESNKDFAEIDNLLKQISSLLSHSEVGFSLIKTDILKNNLLSAYKKSKILLSQIKGKGFNQEYYVPGFFLFCETIVKELQNRQRGNPQIVVPEKELVKDFYKYSFLHWFSCLSFPAYWGAFYRNIATILALKGHKHIASHYFKKSIKKHHLLDMRYEEARSIRDYGLFLEDCNLPGRARDEFAKAYRIFDSCGALLETERLKEKVAGRISSASGKRGGGRKRARGREEKVEPVVAGEFELPL